MNITKIIITDGSLDIGLDATEQDFAEWRERAAEAMAKAFPTAEISFGHTDSMNSSFRLESDDEDADVGRGSDIYQYAVQVLERMW
jgi:hypothetical protein